MTTYTVHEPPKSSGDAAADAERFVFVRDGFYFWAFLLGPLWFLWRRLWLVLLLYLVFEAALHVGLSALGVSHTVRVAVRMLIALLVGFEAGTLWRWTLNRRRWTEVGVVVGRNREEAERRFFDAYLTEPRPSLSPPPLPAVAQPRVPQPAPAVIGLFPEPEPRR